MLKCLLKNKSVNCVAHYVIMNHEEPQNNEPASAGVRRSAPAEACVTNCLCVFKGENRCDSPIDDSESQPITHIASRFVIVVCLM